MNQLLPAPGGAQAVTWHTKRYLRHILAGARKISTLAHFLACLHTLVAKRALVSEKGALIRVTRHVTLALASHAQRWGLLKIVSVGGTPLRKDVKIRIMNVAGVVARFAATFFLVVSIHASFLATRGFVEPAK